MNLGLQRAVLGKSISIDITGSHFESEIGDVNVGWAFDTTLMAVETGVKNFLGFRRVQTLWRELA